MLGCSYLYIQRGMDLDDRTGGGEFQIMYGSKYSSLSVCRNDRDTFVAWACGFDLELK